MLEILFSLEGLVSLLTLTLMEIVLGVDNVIFISILSDKLPKNQQSKARVIGLALALLIRVGLLLGINYIIKFQQPLFEIFDTVFSWRDIILTAGGAFLIYKSTIEIHHKLEGEEIGNQKDQSLTLAMAITQIVLLDVVFSFDSILTAIGLSDYVIVMIVAVIISMLVMLIFAGKLSRFISKHPTVKMLALAFLLMIGVLLIVEGFHQHVPKGYIYSAMAFALVVELLNLLAKRKRNPVKLRSRFHVPEPDEE